MARVPCMDDTNTFELTEGAGVELVGAGETGTTHQENQRNIMGQTSINTATNTATSGSMSQKYTVLLVLRISTMATLKVTSGVHQQWTSLTFDLLGYYGDTDGIRAAHVYFDVEKYHHLSPTT